MFYLYDQNNTRGYFEGPAYTVLVEANSRAHAENLIDGYGMDSTSGCYCCGGYRWSVSWEDPTETPLIDDKSPQEYIENHKRNRSSFSLRQNNDMPFIVVFYLDGRKEEFWYDSPSLESRKDNQL